MALSWPRNETTQPRPATRSLAVRLALVVRLAVAFVSATTSLVTVPATAAETDPAANTAVAPPDAASLALYTGKIRPLFQERCFSCHGGLKQEAGLRLDTVPQMLEGGESGPAIVRAKPAASLLVARTSDPDPASRMPPEGEGEPLTPEQMAVLKAWIVAGCPAPPNEKPEADPRDHWAFQPRQRPAVPAVANAGWVRNPIDAFVSQAHERAGLVPQPEADRGLLVRRLFLDLIGLPPSPDELAAIEADRSTDWYERLVDRLLADPRHGERWARHWMDVWRYSDWWGLGDEQRNSQKHIWRWRDWIVESLNADLPYDEMVRQMLAADELYPEDPSKLRATGYLARNWFKFNRTAWLDGTVEHVGKGLLGLTMNCSKCHDHKYDPIQQADYYRMRAFFEPYHARQDVVPGEADVERDGLPRVFDARLEEPTYLFVRGDDANPDKSRPLPPGVPEVIAFKDLAIEPVQLPKASFQPERRPWVIDSHRKTADRVVGEAEAVLAKALERLGAEAAPPSAGDGKADDAQPAKTQGEDPRLSFVAAEWDLLVAREERLATALRAEAMRAGWAAEDSPSDSGATEPLRRAAAHAARAAARAEREVALAKARQRVAKMQAQYPTATAEKRKSIDKALPQAREEAAKAAKAVDEPSEAFSPLPGATWSTTRFAHTGTDDPGLAFPATSTGRRRALANWITDPRNPLTARVAANHIWLRHMGRPLVSTVFDFGRKGNAPTHPELLDWLASELVDGPGVDGPGRKASGGSVPHGGGWSMKHLHRVIVTSAAYRMSSSIAESPAARSATGVPGVAANNLRLDPDNKLVWRRDSIRLEAQVIRDCMLALAGTLDATMGGPPVPSEEQAGSNRRSLYFVHSDISQNAFLNTFDDASVKECYQRDQSIVPQQALALANAALPLDCAARISERIAAAVPEMADEAFIERAFVTVLDRRPLPIELADCRDGLARWRSLAADPGSAAGDPARAHLVWALLNHNDFVTLR